jgi:GNAT superfamily N-acetyltransferase
LAGNDLVARACETAAVYLALGNETFKAHGARFVRNRETSRRYDANHVGLIRVADPMETEALIARLDVEYTACSHRRFDVDPLTPPQFVARLVLDGGYSTGDVIWGVLEDELRASPKKVEIREVLSEEDWRAYSVMEQMWSAEEQSFRTLDDVLLAEAVISRRLKAPAVRGWFACVDGVPRAFFSSWPGENGVGMVEDLFTHPDYRHQGLATTLIARCVADARDRGAGSVIIGADPNNTPKHMYAAMGFRPLFVSRNYLKLIEPDESSIAGRDQAAEGTSSRENAHQWP